MSFVSEFKEFINRGNVMDMAVGVVVGGAFTAIVTSLTTNIIDPLIKFVTGGGGTEISGLVIPVPGSDTGIDFGAFISAIINFLIVAFVLFLVLKAFNKAQNLGGDLTKGLANTVMTKVIGEDGVEKEVEVEMVPPTCPFCLEEIKEGATRCPHCAGALPEPAKPTPKEA